MTPGEQILEDVAMADELRMRLMRLIAAAIKAERESCARECDVIVKTINLNRVGVVDTMRLEHLAAMHAAAERCAAAIRARSQDI